MTNIVVVSYPKKYWFQLQSFLVCTSARWRRTLRKKPEICFLIKARVYGYYNIQWSRKMLDCSVFPSVSVQNESSRSYTCDKSAKRRYRNLPDSDLDSSRHVTVIRIDTYGILLLENLVQFKDLSDLHTIYLIYRKSSNHPLGAHHIII